LSPGGAAASQVATKADAIYMALRGDESALGKISLPEGKGKIQKNCLFNQLTKLCECGMWFFFISMLFC